MYKFKTQEAESSLKEFLYEHPNHEKAKLALQGDFAAMLDVYYELCGDDEYEDGAGYDATMIIFEAVAQKYTPAMVAMARMEMCQDDEYWPEGLAMLLEAKELGDESAGLQLKNDWHNCVKDWYEDDRNGERINKYKEYSIGFYFLHGIEIEKNIEKAIAYFESSAKKGCEEAKKILDALKK